MIPCTPGHTHDSTHQSGVDEIPEIPRLSKEGDNGSIPDKETEEGSHLEDVNQTGLDYH